MPDLRHAIVIEAAADRVTALVSTPEGFAAWWAEDVARLSGSDTVELGFFNRSTVYRLAPDADADAIRWRCETGQEWAGTELVFRVQPKGAQTRLEFTHARWTAETDYFVSCNTVWGHLMFRLKDAAEGAPAARPLFTKTGMASSSTPLY